MLAVKMEPKVAFSKADTGKEVKIEGNSVTLDGEPQLVSWGAAMHSDCSGRITSVDERPEGTIQLGIGEQACQFQNPIGVPCQSSGCNGHGVCGSDDGMCSCSPGTFGQDCSDTPIRGAVIQGNVSECGLPGTVLYTGLGGQQFLRCEDPDLAQGGWTTVEVALLTPPTSEVTCSIKAERAEVNQTELRFEVAAPRSLTVKVGGVMDVLPENERETFELLIRCSSADTRYETASWRVRGTSDDVEFPVVVSMSPMISSLIGQQVTLTGSNFDAHGELQVNVGGVDVSQLPVLRTVMLNVTSDSLYEITFDDNETELVAWERAADALWNVSTSVERRRAKGAKGGKGTTAALGSEEPGQVIDNRFSKNWYQYWSVWEAAERGKGQPPVFHADESYDGLTALNTTVQKLVPKSDSGITILRRLPSGPLVGRIVLSVANLTLADSSFRLYREYVQPYNFTQRANSLSFLTPFWPDLEQNDSYVNVTVLSPVGSAAVLSEALYYTEDCPAVGMFGRGIACSKCARGGFCPGGRKHVMIDMTSDEACNCRLLLIGNRIWPLAGFWNPGESAGFVGACTPSLDPNIIDQKCIGGKNSLCQDGYAGAYCAKCAPNYYRQV